MFTHDAAEPTTGGGTTLLPAGTYDLVIVKVEEKKTAKGNYPMVNVTCEVRNNEEFNGAKVYHNVTFMPKDKSGAGMSSHFLKCINQPYEGAINVDSDAWVGEDFKAKMIQEDFTFTKGEKIGQVKKVNAIKEIFASDDVSF